MTITREEAKLLLIRPIVSSNVMSETKAREIEAYNMAIEALSADKVEVVRCKDCKNRAKHVVCHFLGEDGFCPYGERGKGDEAE